MSEELRKQDVWHIFYKDLVSIKIVHWGVENFFNNGRGTWNYYIFIHERFCPRFDELWLEDKLSRFSETSPEHVSHDYMSGATGELDMHGGITYYAKNGYSKGHRSVELGCDYNHYWDEGRAYTIEAVLVDAKASAEQAIEIYQLKDLSK